MRRVESETGEMCGQLGKERSARAAVEAQSAGIAADAAAEVRPRRDARPAAARATFDAIRGARSCWSNEHWQFRNSYVDLGLLASSQTV